MNKHTETPYHVDNFNNKRLFICSASNSIIAEMPKMDRVDDAQFIVRSCNNYEAMKKALKEIQTESRADNFDAVTQQIISAKCYLILSQLEDGE